MNRLFILLALVGLTTFALADRDRWRAGTVGTVTAYEADGRTVIENKPCFKTGRYGSYDYARCSSRLRDAVKLELCRKNGSGTHTWFHQIGDHRPTRTSTFCARRY